MSAPPPDNLPGKLPDHLGDVPEDRAASAGHATPDAITSATVARMIGASTTLPTKPFFSDFFDRYLFLAFALAGILLIVVIKLVFAVTGLITAVPPAVLLVLYAVYVNRHQYFKLHPDRLGDNCYYMGFIFTLTSLSVALVQLEDANADVRSALLETLIGNFGIALSSTIFGIALRVFFIQFRREIEDEEVQIRKDLQTTSAALRDNLGLAVSDLESFRLRVIQVLDEQVLAVATRFAEVQRQIIEQTEAASAAITAGQTGLVAQSTGFASAIGTSAAEISSNTAAIASELGRLSGRIDRIEAPPDLITRNIAGAEAQISALATALGNFAQQDTSRAVAFTAATDALVQHLSQLSETSRFTRLEASATSLEQRFSNLDAAATRYARAVETLSAAASNEQTALAGIRTTMLQDARNSAEAARLLQETLSDIARGIAAKLG